MTRTQKKCFLVVLYFSLLHFRSTHAASHTTVESLGPVLTGMIGMRFVWRSLESGLLRLYGKTGCREQTLQQEHNKWHVCRAKTGLSRYSPSLHPVLPYKRSKPLAKDLHTNRNSIILWCCLLLRPR